MNAPLPPAVRSAFEKWSKAKGFTPNRLEDGRYAMPQVNDWWNVWQSSYRAHQTEQSK